MNTKLLWLWLVVIAIGAFFAIERLVNGPAIPPPIDESPSEVATSSYVGATADDIRVLTPQASDTISSPLVVTGEARGPWYFEATFSAVLVDWDGLIIAEVPVMTAEDWMTTDFVPFRVEIPFARPAYGDRGALILQKANASGLPEHDAAVEIPIFFEQ